MSRPQEKDCHQRDRTHPSTTRSIFRLKFYLVETIIFTPKITQIGNNRKCFSYCMPSILTALHIFELHDFWKGIPRQSGLM